MEKTICLFYYAIFSIAPLYKETINGCKKPFPPRPNLKKLTLAESNCSLRVFIQVKILRQSTVEKVKPEQSRGGRAVNARALRARGSQGPQGFESLPRRQSLFQVNGALAKVG
jgi:hypothetical protein